MEMNSIRLQGHPQINDENIAIQNICEEEIEVFKLMKLKDFYSISVLPTINIDYYSTSKDLE